MEQSSSKVTVQYFDPHDVYKLVGPGLIPRLPLRHLNWHSHAGSVRSIDTLHTDFVAVDTSSSLPPSSQLPQQQQQQQQLTSQRRSSTQSSQSEDASFQNQRLGWGGAASTSSSSRPVSSSPSTTNRPSTSDTVVSSGFGVTSPVTTPAAAAAAAPLSAAGRRHQIPGLRRTPYLKVLFVRCDDSDTYKSTIRSEIKAWIKANTLPSDGKKKSTSTGMGGSSSLTGHSLTNSGSGSNNASSTSRPTSNDGHDACEWLIVHVVVPNTVAATQPRTTVRNSDGVSDNKTTSLWRGGSSTILEKMRNDFNSSTSSKSYVDRIAQIRIGINDVPYDLLPRVVPAVPSGYVETASDVDASWEDFIAKLKSSILHSFDQRVSQYEEDIREREAQRSLPGWNFCTFFMLQEGLARGFESVGLVEDALANYDRLSQDLDELIQSPQSSESGSVVQHSTLLPYTKSLKLEAERILNATRHRRDSKASQLDGEGDARSLSQEEPDALDEEVERLDDDGEEEEGDVEDIDEESVQLDAPTPSNIVISTSPVGTSTSTGLDRTPMSADSAYYQKPLPPRPGFGGLADIPVMSTLKPYREQILANDVSLFDFRCYIFARQLELLLRLGNASSSREELLAKLREQQESVLRGVMPSVPLIVPHQPPSESENLLTLAEVCKRTMQFIPIISHVMRQDMSAAFCPDGADPQEDWTPDAVLVETIDCVIASFTFSLAQQVLAQTLTKALPIPPSPTIESPQRESIPDPSLTLHPQRQSSARLPTPSPGPPSPGIFPGAQDGYGGNIPYGASFSSSAAGSGTLTVSGVGGSTFARTGLELLAARRGELYSLSRSVLHYLAKKQGWDAGWKSVPVIHDEDVLEDVVLTNDYSTVRIRDADDEGVDQETMTHLMRAVVVSNRLLEASMRSETDFLRLYEILTDKALRHYTVAGHHFSAQTNLVDLAVLKAHVGDDSTAVQYFQSAAPFYEEQGWSLMELSLLLVYARSLQRLERHPEYMRVAIRLLMKVCTAKRVKLLANPSALASLARPRFGGYGHQSRDAGDNFTPQGLASALDLSPVDGVLAQLLATSDRLETVNRIPLVHFFHEMEMVGGVEYFDDKDAFAVRVQFISLLPETLPIQSARLRLSNTTATRVRKEAWLEVQRQHGSTETELLIAPGKGELVFTSNGIIPGEYRIEHIVLVTHNISISYTRDTSGDAIEPASRPLSSSGIPSLPSSSISSSSPLIKAIFQKRPTFTVFQPSRALRFDVALSPDTRLYEKNSVDVTVETGGNELVSGDMTIRPASGGLRLLSAESSLLEPAGFSFAKAPEAGLFSLGAVSAGTTVRFRLPYLLENEIPEISLRVEISYKSKDCHDNTQTCVLSQMITVNVALAVGVSVEDVFKHDALYSRFSISTANFGPVWVYGTELSGSKLYEAEHSRSSSGARDTRIPLFDKQPSGQLFRIRRKSGSPASGSAISVTSPVLSTANPTETTEGVSATMYLRVSYVIVRDFVAEVLLASLTSSLQQYIEQRNIEGSDPRSNRNAKASELTFYQRPLLSLVKQYLLQEFLTTEVLETIMLTEEWTTGSLLTIAEPGSSWLSSLRDLTDRSVIDLARETIRFLRWWQEQTPVLKITPPTVDDFYSASSANDKTNGKLWSFCSLLIPVDIPSMPLVLTTDISINASSKDKDQTSLPSSAPNAAVVNQVVPCTLQIKWTRRWDASLSSALGTNGLSGTRKSQLLAYEIEAPTDMWIIAGQWKGALQIGSTYSAEQNSLKEWQEGRVSIPFVLIPLVEGPLPYPTLAIHEIQPTYPPSAPDAPALHDVVSEEVDADALLMEVDSRNACETIQVVRDLQRVTVSLDTIGPIHDASTLYQDYHQYPNGQTSTLLGPTVIDRVRRSDQGQEIVIV